jgi:hypothetical protein
VRGGGGGGEAASRASPCHSRRDGCRTLAAAAGVARCARWGLYCGSSDGPVSCTASARNPEHINPPSHCPHCSANSKTLERMVETRATGRHGVPDVVESKRREWHALASAGGTAVCAALQTFIPVRSRSCSGGHQPPHRRSTLARARRREVLAKGRRENGAGRGREGGLHRRGLKATADRARRNHRFLSLSLSLSLSHTHTHTMVALVFFATGAAAGGRRARRGADRGGRRRRCNTLAAPARVRRWKSCES